MKDTYKTEVIFRFWESDIIALFPYEIADPHGNIQSYQHMGQHGGADYKHIIRSSRPATIPEQKDLFKELENIGYNLKIVKKQYYKRYLNNFNKLLKNM